MQTFKEAAAAITAHRPVRPEEAARGKLDYVQVADWGDGDRSKLGELRLVSHVQQYEGSASGTTGAKSPGSSQSDSNNNGGGEGGGVPPFHMQLARQLQMAEARGALAVAGPPPPPLAEWSFREQRYEQYLADQLAVHEALETALREAAASIATTAAANKDDAANVSQQASQPPPPPSPPVQDAVHALMHLIPGRLGLERSGAIRRDLEALRATAAGIGSGATTADSATRADSNLGSVALYGRVELAGRSSAEVMEPPSAVAAPPSIENTAAGPMARSYVQVLRRLGRVAAAGEDEKERQLGALRLLAHAAVVYLAGQAVCVRLGATATERLALLPRRAAATYHEYPREAVFDEVASAMQKTGLLLSALAHRD
ncbi:hypothetical protein VOLCADRAFT_99778 [Volvox carteri f. nagariensis]|uniref:Uncharacterized protein n=1 Tax=Volvox carteri f. nagariensis TaxID=3068 RepID=D8UIM4_VOLCA|nr:uncharacterized protein VOLCADRAFT_99778 [Volvox carteri f. nagariensis]EFJ40438.1 hypothetical protein VOLCADRAFT_99778 [Volvox carteri f. nagariensis]|eukprot:XP_002958518.1 hypothetical protein VOLCADRAFT_99778 [Volvox carteri f. nagariensis]